MATVRRGLPRTRGGEPWPPAGVVASGALASDAVASGLVGPGPVEMEIVAPSTASAAESISPAGSQAVEMEIVAPSTRAATESISSQADPGAVVANPTPSITEVVGTRSALRRGLPRIAGGEPWPPAGVSAPVRAVLAPEMENAGPSVPAGASSISATASMVPEGLEGTPALERKLAAETSASEGATLRRGLPRVAGGEAWPPAGTAVTAVAAAGQAPGASTGSATGTAATDVAPPGAVAEVPLATDVARRPDVSVPLPFTRTVWSGSAPRRVVVEPVASKLRPTWPQAIGGLFAAAGLAVLAGAAIAIVRAFLSLPFMQDFLTTYPGEYHLPAGAPVGIPGWIGWQHFFNVFLMTLIIRSGLRVRSEKRPTAFWTPRGNPKGKISLTLWFHQGLDLLWIVNGVVFVVLLFVTGQWMRIVPTSWDVFPNALSALLQYVSFDWPTENGWVNYNSLQQLAYFTIVFLAAPVAIATGFRMSGLWPKKAEGLSKAYPIEIARAVHFPTMLFFTAFIVVHVALVLLTGMLRNLNHMFAAQDAVTWTGFWVFVLSLIVIAGGWVAARPLVLAPIAKLFGQVSGR